MFAPLGMLISFVWLAVYFQLAEPPVAEAGLDLPQEMPQLISAWENGEVIALVRHAERCDRSRAPCLGAPDGITARGKDLAGELGEAFAQLGPDRADVFASPLTRTKQTARYMFGTAIAERDWLASCKNMAAIDFARHKADGRNLVLVTHSHCIKQIQKDMKLAADKPDYGALLFIRVDNGGTPIAAGLIEAEEFIAGIGASG